MVVFVTYFGPKSILLSPSLCPSLSFRRTRSAFIFYATINPRDFYNRSSAILRLPRDPGEFGKRYTRTVENSEKSTQIRGEILWKNSDLKASVLFLFAFLFRRANLFCCYFRMTADVRAAE